MKRGYLPLYRKIQDHMFYKEKRVFSKYEAWIDILMEVQQKLDTESVLIGMNVVTCGHGQSLNSLRTWGERWGWSGKKVSRFFILLEKLKQIKSENVTVTTRITVLNYNVYDVKCHANVTQGKHEGNSCDTVVKHECPTDNNVKNENNEKNVNKYMDSAKRIITKLNELAGKKFRFGTNNTTNIIGRLKEGFTESDCFKVLETKIKDKYFMENMKYYCPETLFRPSNFEKYLNETPAEKEGLVICLDRTIYDKSDYQAKGLHKTSDVVYMNLRPEFITDEEREDVELNTSRFISEFCEGGF